MSGLNDIEHGEGIALSDEDSGYNGCCHSFWSSKATWATLIIIGTLGVVLILVLVPLTFSYVEWNQMAFKKNTVTNKVDTSEVHPNGRYAWGPMFTPLTFPTTYQRIAYRDNDLLIFSDNGLEFNIEVDVYYQLDPERLRAIFDDFGTSYHERFHDAIRASLKNSAPTFTVDEYVTDRQRIADYMLTELNKDLADLHLSIDHHKLQLLRVVFPAVIRDKFLQTAVQELVNARAQLEQEVEVIRKDTEKIIEGINANVTIVSQTAQSQARTVVVSSQEQSKNIVQTALGSGVNSLLTELGVASPDDRKTLFELLTVKDGRSDQRALIGEVASIIQL